MTTLVLGVPPRELEALAERRRRAGVDQLDEVWEGVHHMVPGPSFEHASVDSQVHLLISPVARAAGLIMTGQFNLGEGENDFRVPDAGLHRSGAAGTWLATAAVVIEIVSAGDETWHKLAFYAAHGVEEVVIVDPGQRTVTWLALRDGTHHPVSRSGLIELGSTELVDSIDWP